MEQIATSRYLTMSVRQKILLSWWEKVVWVTSVVIIAGGTFLCYKSIFPDYEKHPSVLTQNKLAKILFLLAMLEKYTAEKDCELLYQKAEKEGWQVVLPELIKALNHKIEVENTKLNWKEEIKELSQDAWGHPFLAYRRKTLEDRKEAKELLLIWPYRLVVWSSGRNGINEWGRGDDVVLEAQQSHFEKNQ